MTMATTAGSVSLSSVVVERIVERALEEDLGRAGDVTSVGVLSEALTAEAAILARQGGTIAGLDTVKTTFELVDAGVECTLLCRDGQQVGAGERILEVKGGARSILAAERTALNFLGHLSGIATATAALVAAVEGSGCRIVCTRKTTPGLRVLEKHAVRCGGGANHRFGLDDGILIKDNHRDLAGGACAAIRRLRGVPGRIGHMMKVEVELDRLDELEELLSLGVDAILLDNMTIEELSRAVETVDGRATIEASGNVTLETVAAIAATGVDVISSGWITHSAPALDVSLEVRSPSLA